MWRRNEVKKTFSSISIVPRIFPKSDYEVGEDPRGMRIKEAHVDEDDQDGHDDQDDHDDHDDQDDQNDSDNLGEDQESPWLLAERSLQGVAGSQVPLRNQSRQTALTDKKPMK